MNPQKLAQLQSTVRIGGKGTPRRKVKKPVKSAGDSSKIITAIKKLGPQPVDAIEEVNMFQKDGRILHFNKPSVTGSGVVKELAELVPGIFSQMGAEALEGLRKMAQEYQHEHPDEVAKAQRDMAGIPQVESFE